MRHKIYFYNGKFYDSYEMGTIFNISPGTFRNRFNYGWRIVDDHFIPPKRKERKSQFIRDYEVSVGMAKQLKRSFMGESISLI